VSRTAAAVDPAGRVGHGEADADTGGHEQRDRRGCAGLEQEARGGDDIDIEGDEGGRRSCCEQERRERDQGGDPDSLRLPRHARQPTGRRQERHVERREEGEPDGVEDALRRPCRLVREVDHRPDQEKQPERDADPHPGTHLQSRPARTLELDVDHP
jgi:hypothetical protein